MSHDEAETGWKQIHVRHGRSTRNISRGTCTTEITYIKDAVRIHTSDLCDSVATFLLSRTQQLVELAYFQISMAYNPQASGENFRLKLTLVPDKVKGKIYATYARSDHEKWSWHTTDDLGAWALYIAHVDLELPEGDRLIFKHINENKVRHHTCFRVDAKNDCLIFTGTVRIVNKEEYMSLLRIRAKRSPK